MEGPEASAVLGEEEDQGRVLEVGPAVDPGKDQEGVLQEEPGSAARSEVEEEDDGSAMEAAAVEEEEWRHEGPPER